MALDIPCRLGDIQGFDKRSILIGGDTLKIVAYILWEREVGRVALFEATDEWREDATLRLLG